jgi:hypothetical protein
VGTESTKRNTGARRRFQIDATKLTESIEHRLEEITVRLNVVIHVVTPS